MDLVRVFDPDSTVFDLLGTERDHAILELVRRLEGRGCLSPGRRDEVLLGLLKRESRGSTAVGRGVALPHIRTDHVEEIRGAIGISQDGIDFAAPDGKAVHLVMLFLAPAWAVDGHLQLLGHLAKLVQVPDFVGSLLGAKEPREVRGILEKADSFLGGDGTP